MKSIFLLSMLLMTLVSCKSETSQQDCYYNNVKVSCDQLHSSSQDRQKPISEKVNVEVVVQGKYEIKNGTFKALTSMTKKETKNVNGNLYSCEIDLPKNREMGIDVDERELRFSMNGQLLTLERTSLDEIDYENMQLGKFEHFDSSDNTTSFFNFISKDLIELKVICHF